MAILIENKDWNRMYDLIVDGKDGASVARSIKQRDKAIARYVAAMKLLSGSPAIYYDDNTFTGPFCDFANKALELGASYDDIYAAWDQCPRPDDLIEKVKDYLATVNCRASIPDNFFKELRHAGIPIITSSPNHEPSDSGRQYSTIDIRFYPDTYDESSISLEIYKDTNSGPNLYRLRSECELETTLNGTFGYNELRTKLFKALSSRYSDIHLNN